MPSRSWSYMSRGVSGTRRISASDFVEALVEWGPSGIVAASDVAAVVE